MTMMKIENKKLEKMYNGSYYTIMGCGDDAIYEIVDDDTEFSAVAKLFEELVGDEADFEM